MVKCAECGFLTMRNLFTGQLDEVDGDLRKTGNPPQHKETVVGGPSNKVAEITKTPYRLVPMCFARTYPLADEIPASEDVRSKYPDLPATMVLEVITKERACADYTKWQQGFTPKEHREMLDRQRRRQFEAEQREKDRQWQERQEDKAEQRHKEQLDTLKSQHKSELIIFGVIVTLIIVASTIIGAIIEGAISAGWSGEPSWWPF